MYLHSEPDGKLIVSSTSSLFDWLLLVGAALCTVPTVRGALQGTFNLHDSTPLAGSAFFLLCFMICYERTRFEFDPTLGLVRWFSKRIFSTKTGSLPFGRVKSVILQTSLGSDATCPSARLALVTDQGELPLCKAYAGGTGEEYETIAARIRTLLQLGPASSDVVLDTIRAAVEQGRKIEAIRLLRLHKGMTLTEAKAFIDNIRRSSHPTSS